MKAARAILTQRRGLCHACRLVETDQMAGRLFQCAGCTAAVPRPLAAAPHDLTGRDSPRARVITLRTVR